MVGECFFWTNCWLGGSPLAIRFPRLFDSCASKDILVADVLPVSAISLQFCHSFGPVELELWAALVQETSSVELSNNWGSVRWTLNLTVGSWCRPFIRKTIRARACPMKISFGVLSFRSKLRSFFGRWRKEGYLLMNKSTGDMGRLMAVVRFVDNLNL
jgi:hypothetical protein